jgi:DNA-binding response OmpR family regulator
MRINDPQRILIVDDEAHNLRLAVETLRDFGFDLMTARNGEDGLFTAREGRPELILLDILMPGLDGFGVCSLLKSEPSTRGIPVVFLTGQTDTEQKLRAFQVGGVDYITKPFDAREVLARVVLHLDQHRLSQHLQHRLEAFEQAAKPLDEPSPAERSLGL